MNPLDIISGVSTAIEGISGLFDLGTRVQDRMRGQSETDFKQASQDLSQENLQWQKAVSEKNFQVAQDQAQWQKDVDKRNFDYSAHMQQVQMAREDTAHQREVADLKSAGLSPLASLNGSTTGTVVSQAAGVSPVVPQQDGTGVANAYATAISNKQAMAGLQMDLLRDIFKAGTNLEFQKRSQEHETKIAKFEAQSKIQQIITQFEGQADLQEDSQAHSILMWAKQTDRDLTLFNQSMAKLAKEQTLDVAKENARSLRESTGANVEIVYGKTETEAADHNAEVMALYDELISELSAHLTKTATSQSSQGSGGGSFSVNIPLTKFNDVGGTISGEGGSGQSTSESRDSTKYAEERIRTFWQTHKLWSLVK